MKNPKTYFSLTLFISILFGILLPLALGVKAPTLIAISFCSIWFIYEFFGTCFLTLRRQPDLL
jgi:hypothetical protein